MALIHLGLGSNRHKHKHIIAGVAALAAQPELKATNMRVSRVFRSAAVGFSGKDFFNLVVSFHSAVRINQLNDICKSIESAHGHLGDAAKFSPRTLDIDVLLYDQCCQASGVQLPRPEILDNAFVLWPLAELSPNLRHPQTQVTYLEHWRRYNDNQRIAPVDFRWPEALNFNP